MTTSLEELEQQARALGAEERAKLAECLLESLRSPLSEIEAAWAREIEGRVAAYDCGEMQKLKSRMRLLEGIARGERAVEEVRTLSHKEARTRMSRWFE